MREILFRGKSYDGKWLEGLLFQEEGDCVVHWGISSSPLSANDYSEIMGDWREILPETVGQYTGLTDENGKKIFEGDVVWGDDCTGTWHKGVVEYDDSIGSFIINTKMFMQYPKNENHYDLLGWWVIEGNVHDNPELLEGKQ